tara:strand:+ start:207 stop:482 length:276 start_codon:yes stop_codon:yes gene_type:complete
MIPVALTARAGSMGLKFLRTLYKGKAKIGTAAKKTAKFAANKGYPKTSQFITGTVQKTHKGTKNIKKFVKKYPKSSAAVTGAVAWDMLDNE